MVEFNSVFLLKMRREALRKRVWFKVLDGTERALLYLVPRCMETPKNPTLIDALAKIIVKIKNALKSRMANLVFQIGKPLAEKLSLAAQEWGNKTACKWAADEGFWKYLTIVNLNTSPGPRMGARARAFTSGLSCLACYRGLFL
jgi:hypothetical protein